MAKLIDWLTRMWGRELPRHEEVTMRYRAIRGKSVEVVEQEILERLYAKSPDA